MLKTGLANMAYGVVIALAGALITGVTYAMVSDGGGTYVVAYGAFVVGAWRFLLGLFQVLRGAVSGPEAEIVIPQSPRAASAAPAPAGVPRPTAMSGALHIVGWVLIADAALRIFSLGSLLWRMRVPFAELFYDVPFLLTAIAVPAVFIAGGLVAGALVLRNRPAAIPFGVGYCVAGLLFQAYGLWRLSMFAFRVPWLTWAFVSIHVTISIASLVVLLRSSDRRGLAAPPAGARTDAPASPGTRL